MKTSSKRGVRLFLHDLLLKADPERLRSDGTATAFVEHVLQQVEDQWPQPAQKHVTLPIAIKCLRAFARANQLRLPLPLIMKRRPSPQPLRREHWAGDARFSFDCNAALQAVLLRRPTDPQLIARLLTASAILRGGLARPTAWIALWECLQKGAVGLSGASRLKNLVWLDLDLPVQQKRPRTTEFGETLRFFPDVVTLSLIRRWNKNTDSLPEFSGPMQLLGHVLSDLNINKPPPLHRFAAASFAALEDQLENPIPQALFNVASEDLMAFSATGPDWDGYLAGGREPSSKTKTGSSRKAMEKPKRYDVTDAADSLVRLNVAISARTPGAPKRTRAPVLEALSALMSQPLAPVIRGLALWYTDLLRRRLKVSTVRRYHDSIARMLTAQFGDENPADMLPGGVEMFCAAGLEPLNPQAAAYSAGRLASFFEFAANDIRLAWPDIDAVCFGVDPDGSGRVCTALVSGADIRRGLQELDEVGRIALLMGARGGLRLSDMEALTVGDIEQAEFHGMVGVHQTALGDLKTAASRRKICLSDLLTSSERKKWQSFVEDRRRFARSDKEPFLATSSPLTGPVRFDRRAFAHSLGQITGLRPHDLRHGAISNLALLLMSPPESKKEIGLLTGWTRTDQENILKMFQKGGRARGLDELSRMAGHTKAETTFASYIHLSDLVLGMHIAAMEVPLPREDTARILGINKASLPRGKGNIASETLRSVILKDLPVKEIVAKPALPDPNPVGKTQSITPEIVLRAAQALDEGQEPFDIAQTLDLPHRLITRLDHYRRSIPKRSRLSPRLRDDCVLGKDIAEHILAFAPKDATAWSAQTLAIRHVGMKFRAPVAAQNWIGLLPKKISCSASLTLKAGEEADRWRSFGAQQITNGPRTHLFLHPRVKANGRSATSALRYAALIVGYMSAAAPVLGPDQR